MARLGILVAAAFAGLPVLLSQQLVETMRKPSSPTPPPWQEIALDSGGLRLRAWLARGARHTGGPSAPGYWETVLGFVEGAASEQPVAGASGESR